MNLEDYFLDENIFVNYMGHGNFDCWWTYFNSFPNYVYYNDNPYNGLCNDFTTISHFPLITSFACLTGAFHNNDDCMAEEFLCSDSNSGAIAFIGASISTSILSYSRTCPFFYNSIYKNDLYVIGEAFMATKILDQVYSPVYNLLGDPAVNIFIDEENCGLPDLKIEDYFISHEFGYPNYENCFIEISILNQSPVEIPENESFDVEVYYKEFPTSTDSTLLFTETIYGMQGAVNHIIEYTWNAGYENLGYNYITVSVDTNGEIAERIENNNYAIQEVIITNEMLNFPITLSDASAHNIFCGNLLNNDNLGEVLVDRNLIVLDDMNNNWFYDSPGGNMVLGDLNYDDEIEIYAHFTDDHTIKRININDGTEDQSFLINNVYYSFLSIDKDILYSFEKDTNYNYSLKLYEFDGTYTIISNWGNLGIKPPPPSLCDINNDGYKEIGIILNDEICVFDGSNGNILFSVSNIYPKDLIFVDIDKNGIWNLITNNTTFEGDRIFTYDPLNNSLICSSSLITDEEINEIIASDTDDDGFPEIVFTTESKLRVFDFQSNTYTLENEINNLSFNSIVSGNINNDTYNEIIILNTHSYFENEKPTLMVVEPISGLEEYLIYPQDIYPLMSLYDLDSDGKLEIICNSSHLINSFDFLNGSNNIEWGQHRHDINNNACYDTRVYNLPENSDIIWSNKIILKGSIELPQSSTLSIAPGTIVKVQQGIELIVLGELTAEGTEERPIKFTADDPNAGNQYWSGITLLNGSSSSFKYCEIENAEYAILYEDIESEDHTFENCLIKDNYTGIGVYSSSPVIKENIIRDNTIGIACFNDSSPILTDLGPVNEPFRNGIINNILGICIDYSLPYLKNGYNDIYSTSRDNYIEMHHDDVNLRASQNYWGTTDIEEIYNHLLPPESYSIIPVLDTPQSSYIPSRDAQFEMIKNAYIYLENQDYLNAELTFKDILEIYPETSEAYLAISGLFICYEKSNGSWNDYELYLNQVAQDSLISEKFTKLLDCYYNLSKREKEEYDTAIANYESVLLNNPSYQDSCYAVIDIGNTYIEAGFNGREASGKFSNLHPKSVIHHAKETRKLLLSIFNPEQYPPTVPEIYKFSLHPNYPNPFNPSTTISFSIPKESKTETSIYNIKGQKVRTLIKDKLEAGNHSVIWYGKDSSGKEVGSGIYFYLLKVNGKDKAVRKCLLLK